MYFGTKSYLKNNRNYTAKQALNPSQESDCSKFNLDQVLF